MENPAWTSFISSEWNLDYVEPLLPRLGDSVKIRLRHPDSAPVDQVWLRPILNGGDANIQMKDVKGSPGFRWWEAQLRIEEPHFQYSFLLLSEQSFFYYTRHSVTLYPQTEDHDWVLFADWDFPEWVPGSVFYQIFPDRFRKGDPTVGVRTDEYNYAGGKTIRMSWERKPLSWQQGHCLDFYNGDLEGIRQSISYFKELGINALFINPIFEGRSTHRYDSTDYFHVDRHLGGDEALIKLVKDLHKAGLKIILDVSVNHVGIDHPWVKRALADKRNPESKMFYKTSKGTLEGWYGSPTLPQLNYSSKLVRKYVYGLGGLVRHWLKKPFYIDGWRFDVGNFTARHGQTQLGNKIFRKIRKAVKKTRHDAYILGEHWMDNISFLQGDQWDGAMSYFASARPIRSFLGQRDPFVQREIHQPVPYQPTTGRILAEQIRQHLDRIPNPLLFLQMNLIDSHDVARVHNQKDNFQKELYEAAIALMFVMPGVPNIYYGDELALDGTIDTVEGCRYPMNWNETEWDHERKNFFKDLIQLRRNSQALSKGAWAILHADEFSMSLARWYRNESVICVINRNPHPQTTVLDTSIINLTSVSDWKDKKIATLSHKNLSLNLGPFQGCLLLGISD